nr:alpha/beta hydrolase [Candidatus Njordarchaeota archaeon]
MPIVAVDGSKTHYEECGKGTSIVLIHGAQGTVEGWEGMVSVLKQKYRVITPSLPGRSGSENMLGEITIERYSDHVSYLLQKIGVEKAVIAGCSMGGLVTLSFGLNHPRMALALVLMATGARMPVDERIVKLFEDDPEGTTRLAASMGYSKKTPKEVIEKALVYNINCPKEAMLNDYAATGKFDARQRLHEIKAPTLIMVGSDDILTPLPMAQFLNTGIVGSTLKIIKDAGHSAIIEKPKELSEEIMRFLEKHRIY